MVVNKFSRLSPFSVCNVRRKFLLVLTLGGKVSVGNFPPGNKHHFSRFMRITLSCAGVPRTGGLLLLACVSLPLMAQQQADRPDEKSARVVERGAHCPSDQIMRHR
jgi:hypothetical protein